MCQCLISQRSFQTPTLPIPPNRKEAGKIVLPISNHSVTKPVGASSFLAVWRTFEVGKSIHACSSFACVYKNLGFSYLPYYLYVIYPSGVKQFHLMYDMSFPWSTDNNFHVSLIYANILSGTIFLSISRRYTEWSALYKFLLSTQTDTTLMPPIGDSKNCNWNRFSEQCHKIAIGHFVLCRFASVHVSVHEVDKQKNCSSLEGLTNVFHVLAYVLWAAEYTLTFKRRIKSHLPFTGIIRSSPYYSRFQDNG